MTIDKIHNFILFVLTKEQQSMVSHEHIDDALHSAQLLRFTEFLPPKPGANPIPMAQVEYGATAVSMDYLYPFKAKEDFNQDDTPDGLLKFADDYAHLRAIYVMSYNNKYERAKHNGVPILSENQLAERLSSQIIYPSCTNPVGIEVYEGSKAVQIYPQQPFAGRYYYFKNPQRPKFAYTTEGRKVIFDPDNSVNLAWDEESINAIIYKALQPLGVHLKSPMDVQWAQYKEQKEG